jgi:hypothetical protein
MGTPTLKPKMEKKPSKTKHLPENPYGRTLSTPLSTSKWRYKCKTPQDMLSQHKAPESAAEAKQKKAHHGQTLVLLSIIALLLTQPLNNPQEAKKNNQTPLQIPSLPELLLQEPKEDNPTLLTFRLVTKILATMLLASGTQTLCTALKIPLPLTLTLTALAIAGCLNSFLLIPTLLTNTVLTLYSIKPKSLL